MHCFLECVGGGGIVVNRVVLSKFVSMCVCVCVCVWLSCGIPFFVLFYSNSNLIVPR